MRAGRGEGENIRGVEPAERVRCRTETLRVQEPAGEPRGASACEQPVDEALVLGACRARKGERGRAELEVDHAAAGPAGDVIVALRGGARDMFDLALIGVLIMKLMNWVILNLIFKVESYCYNQKNYFKS